MRVALLMVDGEAVETETPSELRPHVEALELRGVSEVWIELGEESEPCLCILVSEELGWLMYLREVEDPGFSSRNPAYEGPSDAMRSFRLSNGQVDEYPVAWCFPLDVLKAASLVFLETGERSTEVDWFDETTR